MVSPVPTDCDGNAVEDVGCADEQGGIIKPGGIFGQGLQVSPALEPSGHLRAGAKIPDVGTDLPREWQAQKHLAPPVPNNVGRLACPEILPHSTQAALGFRGATLNETRPGQDGVDGSAEGAAQG